MRFPSLLCSLVCLNTFSVNAQYFSKGWAPGQQVESHATQAQTTWEPSATDSPPNNIPPKKGLTALSDLLDPINLIQLGPIPSLLQRVGINVTESIAAVRNQTLWDPRIPLITDDTYEDMIANEELTLEELQNRVWVLVITAAGNNQDSMSKFVDQAFDDAFNRTMLAGDLKNVKWGRIDYLTVTYLTTKWAVWRVPAVVILQDRGQTLRFYQPSTIRLRDGALRELLLVEAWKVSSPWRSAYSPGGEREWLMHDFALIFKFFYDRLVKIPKWLLMIASGAIGSALLGLMHKASEPAQAPRTAAASPAQSLETQTTEEASGSGSPMSPTTQTTPSTPTKSPAKSHGAKKRRGKK